MDERRPNCETLVTFPNAVFCPHCGQERKSLKIPFRDFAADLLEAWLNIDSRLLLTLKHLWQPGWLAAQYISGKRARFAAPMKLCFLITFVCFGVMQIIDIPEITGELNSPETREVAKDLHLEKNKPNLNLTGKDNDTGVSFSVDADFSKPELKPIMTKAIERFYQWIPWVMLLTVPILAWLTMRITKGTNLYFSEALVFASYLMSSVMALELFKTLLGLSSYTAWLSNVIGVLVFALIVSSFHDAFKMTWGRALWASIKISITYLIVFGFLYLATLVVLGAQAYRENSSVQELFKNIMHQVDAGTAQPPNSAG